MKAYCKERWLSRNTELTAQVRQKRADDPEQSGTSGRNAKARRLGVLGTHTKEEVYELLRRQDYKCKNCLAAFVKERNFKGYHIDHIIPFKLKGCNDITNLQALCAHCNLTKHARIPGQFYWNRFDGSPIPANMYGDGI